LRNDIVRVSLAEPSTLKKVHDIRFAGALFIKAVFVFLQSDGAAQNNLIAASWKAVVRVVEYYFDCNWG